MPNVPLCPVCPLRPLCLLRPTSHCPTVPTVPLCPLCPLCTLSHCAPCAHCAHCSHCAHSSETVIYIDGDYRRNHQSLIVRVQISSWNSLLLCPILSFFLGIPSILEDLIHTVESESKAARKRSKIYHYMNCFTQKWSNIRTITNSTPFHLCNLSHMYSYTRVNV